MFSALSELLTSIIILFMSIVFVVGLVIRAVCELFYFMVESAVYGLIRFIRGRRGRRQVLLSNTQSLLLPQPVLVEQEKELVYVKEQV